MEPGTGRTRRCTPYYAVSMTRSCNRLRDPPELPNVVETKLVRPDTDHTPKWDQHRYDVGDYKLFLRMSRR